MNALVLDLSMKYVCLICNLRTKKRKEKKTQNIGHTHTVKFYLSFKNKQLYNQQKKCRYQALEGNGRLEEKKMFIICQHKKFSQ